MMDDQRLDKLMGLAGVATNNSDARCWLETALKTATPAPRAWPRPKPADWNAPLDELKKRADALLEQINTLRRSHPHANSDFWRSPLFALGAEDDEPEEGGVIRVVEKIAIAAAQARVERNGRPPEHRKQHIVDRAAGFFKRYSTEPISSTPTGKFAGFALAFYTATQGRADGGLERQIRKAARAQSGQKPPALS